MLCDDPSPHGPHPAINPTVPYILLCPGVSWDPVELQVMATLAQAGFTFEHLDPHQQPHEERR